MPSFADSIFIFVMALMLFGPKKLPQLARQLGKLMAEFRRASNEFRMQMEDELRIEEQKEHQAKVDAMAGPPSEVTQPAHPHLPALEAEAAANGEAAALASEATGTADSTAVTEPAPIAESGALKMMPPSTGLPVESASRPGRMENEYPSMYGDTHTPEGTLVEHSILPPQTAAVDTGAQGAGISSEDPAAAMVTTGATHHGAAEHVEERDPWLT